MFLRLFRSAGSVVLVVVSVFPAVTQTLTTADSASLHLHTTLRLASAATQYRQGELIQLQLQFTSDPPAQFNVLTEVSNRWITVELEEFHVSPAAGAVDPLAVYEKPFLDEVRRYWQGPLTMSLAQTGLPATINLPLTDWIRFDRPGHYRVSLRTLRASVPPVAPGGPPSLLSLETNEVEFDIIPADAAWQEQQLKEIAAQTPTDWPRLRALGTSDAARFLARQYRAEIHPLDRDVLLGLLGSPCKQAGVEEMSRLLRDPDFAVTPSFLDALALLSAPPPQAGQASISAGLPPLRQQLWEALPAKRGQALVTSKQTYLAGLEQLAAVKFSPDQIIQIIQTFEQLSPMDQNLWLGQRWAQVSDQRWLPVLQRLAARDVNLFLLGRPDFDPVVGITKLALKRWYELDPKTGREAILSEIASSAPRFGADALGILPDQILPAEQHVVAQHFASMAAPAPIAPTPTNSRIRHAAFPAYLTAESHLASLLFRYANRDVVAEVLPAMKNRLAERNCNAQYSEIAFLLKVDSEEGGSFMRAVASNRPNGHSGCAQEMFGKIGYLIATPVLERFAVESLDDNDLAVASAALLFLRDHGSAQAEQPIFDRLVRWNAKWRDHAADLAGMPAPPNPPAPVAPLYVPGGLVETFGRSNPNGHLAEIFGRSNPNGQESFFGLELAQALVLGHGWLADEARIRQLLPLTLEPGARMQLTAAISQLETKPIHIYFMGNNGPMFLLAQYNLDSTDDLKDKLSQYPRGTVFVWSDHRFSPYEIRDQRVSRDIAQWSAAKGIHIDGL